MSARDRALAPPSLLRLGQAADETCPFSTGGGTRRVHLEGGGGLHAFALWCSRGLSNCPAARFAARVRISLIWQPGHHLSKPQHAFWNKLRLASLKVPAVRAAAGPAAGPMRSHARRWPLGRKVMLQVHVVRVQSRWKSMLYLLLANGFVADP